MFRKYALSKQVLATLLIAVPFWYGVVMAVSSQPGLASVAGGGAAGVPPAAAVSGGQHAQPGPPKEIFALNDLGAQERAGVHLEVARVVIGRSDLQRAEGRSLAELGQLRPNMVVGELILKVTNNSGQSVAVPVDEGVILINDEQIRYLAGDDTAGYLLPGGMQITSHLFVISRSQVAQVRQMVLRVAGPVDESSLSLDADYELTIDLSRREYQPRRISRP
jgi:hypothetical protein